MSQDGSISSGAAITPRAIVGAAHALRSISSPFDFSKARRVGQMDPEIKKFSLASNLNASSEEHQDIMLIYCMGDEVDDILYGRDLTDAKHAIYTEV